jgi:hypothetical protein
MVKQIGCLWFLIVFLCLAVFGGCQSETPHGPCIGVFDDENPKLQYKLSVRNTVLGVIFFQTVFVPVIVLANETRCPVGPK